MHITDFSKGNLGANGIVAAGIPIAMGAAIGFQVLGRKNVAVTFFGDGASNQGSFHESANFAAIWKLPVIFVCENNLYASATPTSISLPHPDIAIRGGAYAMPGITVDGQDVLAVYEVVCQAVERARKGEGPSLIEAKTYRYEGHWLGGPDIKPQSEADEWQRRDPIVLFRQVLFKKGLLDEERERIILGRVEAEIAEAAKFALASPEPDPATVMDYIYKEE